MFVECLNKNGLHASEEIARNIKEQMQYACFKDGKLCTELESKDANSFLDVLKHYFVFSKQNKEGEMSPFINTSYSDPVCVEAVGLEENPLRFDFGNFSGMRLKNNANRGNERDVFTNSTFVLLLIIKDDANEGMEIIRFVDFGSDMSQAFTVNGFELFREFFSKELNGNYRDSHVNAACFGLVRPGYSSFIRNVIENTHKENLTRIEGDLREEEEALRFYTEKEIREGPIKCKILSTKIKSLSSQLMSSSKETLDHEEKEQKSKTLNAANTTTSLASELTKAFFEKAINVKEEFKRGYSRNLEGTLDSSVLHNVKETLSSTFNSAILNQGLSYATSSFFVMKRYLTERNLRILRSLNMIEVYGRDTQPQELTDLKTEETAETTETADLKTEEVTETTEEPTKVKEYLKEKHSFEEEDKEEYFSPNEDDDEKYFSPFED